MEGKTEYAMLLIVVVLLGAAGIVTAQEGGGLGRQIANFFTDQENLETTVPPSLPRDNAPTPALEPPSPPSDADSRAPRVAPPGANTPQATPTPAQQSKPPGPPSDADSSAP
ncbi:MAG: hypothetical protein OXI80_15490, partial [Caldilineaceae bacterium]|nr:hypothetical protein [Caldilineaceae bacterium]